jgi:hypothetical protein
MVSNTQQQGVSSFGSNCPFGNLRSWGSNSAIASFTSNASWPGTYPANSAINNGCYAVYVPITYTTTDAYTVVSVDIANCVAADGDCVNNFVPFGSGHSIIIANMDFVGTAGTVSAVDSAGDTISTNGSACSPPVNNCILSAPRATAGTSSATIHHNSSAGITTMVVLEVTGTLSSSSFDQSDYDTSQQATPFTSGSTGTTTQATEFLVGMDYNGNLAAVNAGGTYTASGGWKLLYQGQDFDSGSNFRSIGIFTRTVGSTGAYTLTGSFSTAGTVNIPALATYK